MTTTTTTTTTGATMTGHCVSAKVAAMLRELQSDMADLVASGDLTAEEANEWVNRKAEQWANGIG